MGVSFPESDFNYEENQLVVLDSVDSISGLRLPIKNRSIWSVVCIGGSLTCIVDDSRLTMKQSTLMVLAPGHDIKAIETSADFTGFAISSTVNNLDAFLPVMSRALMCFKVFTTNPVIPVSNYDIEKQLLYHKLLKMKLGEKSDIHTKNVIDSLCKAIIFETLGLYMKRMRHISSAAVKSSRTEELFYRFIVLVEKNYLTQRALSFYADALCVSTKHLSALVKDISGKTAGSWIDSYVIFEAKRLIRSTQLSIQEISERLNFANQSFFGKYFKHLTGESPSQFRNKGAVV